MEIKVSLSLPRDSVSVSVVRHLTGQSLRTLGVADECVTDIETALSEACTNVLLHAADGDEYFVSAGIDGERCVIEVIDAGRGIDSSALAALTSAPTSEQGRGMQLMKNLVDSVSFESRPEAGTIVHMEKALSWTSDDAIGRRLDQEPGFRPATERPAYG